MVITLEEVTTVVVVCEGGFDGLSAGETLDWMTSRSGPQVLNQTVRTGEQSRRSKLSTPVFVLEPKN